VPALARVLQIGAAGSSKGESMRTWKLLLLSLVVGCSAGSVQNGHDPGADAGQSGGGGDDGGTGPMTPGDDGGTLPPAPLDPSIQICNGQTPPLGLGSFARALPPGAKGPQATIYKTARVTGAMPTNHWWSSVAWEPYSEAMFPHPFAVQATAAGLAVDAPRPSAADKGIFAGFAADFTLGSTASASFPDARVDGFSDWAVSMLWSAGAGSLRVTTGSGLPFLYAEFKGGTPTLTFTSAPTVFAGDANASVLGVTIAGHSYGLFAPSGAKWTGLGTATIGTDLAGKDYLSIAALPDASPATLQAFAQYAYSFVTDTRADWAYDEASARVQTTFTVTTVAKEGAQRGTIFALYPHQWKNSGATLLAYQYPTVRGLMKTVAGSSFSTNLTFHGVLPMLPKEPGNLSAADYGQLIRSSLEPANPPAADTYWTGKELGRLATLAPIAELANETATAETARGRLERRYPIISPRRPGRPTICSITIRIGAR
jgi:endoglucanase Acf2